MGGGRHVNARETSLLRRASFGRPAACAPEDGSWVKAQCQAPMDNAPTAAIVLLSVYSQRLNLATYKSLSTQHSH
eukprot:6117299-Amphidinium_carterae.1